MDILRCIAVGSFGLGALVFYRGIDNYWSTNDPKVLTMPCLIFIGCSFTGMIALSPAIAHARN